MTSRESAIFSPAYWAILFCLLTFAWASHSHVLFNGLAAELAYATCAFVAIVSFRGRTNLRIPNLCYLGCVFAWIGISDLLSAQAIPALAKDTHWLLLPTLAVAVENLTRRDPRTVFVAQLAGASCIWYTFATLVVESEGYLFWLRPPIFGHIRHLGLTIGFFATILIAPVPHEKVAAIFFRATRILGFALVVWSGTRAAMLGMLVGSACVMFALRDIRFACQLVQDLTVALLLSVIPPPALPGSSEIGSFLKRTVDPSTLDQVSSFRLSMWRDTLSGLNSLDRLWIGAGGNGFARLQTLWGAPIFPANHVQPHNSAIQVVSDWGIIGFALSLPIAVYVLRALWAFGPRSVAEGNCIATVGIPYLATTSLLDATMYHLEFLVYLGTLIGVLLHRTGLNARRVPRPIPYLLILAVLAAVTFLQVSASHYRIGLPWYFPTR